MRRRSSSHGKRRPSQKRAAPATERAKTANPQKRAHRGRSASAQLGYRVLRFVFFMGVCIYLLGYMLAFIGKSSIPVETVAYGSVETPEVFSGVLVRQEYVAKSQAEGVISYAHSDQERVKSGSLVCSIRNPETAERIENQIEKIDRNILKSQKNREDISLFQEDITRIENSIAETVGDTAGQFMTSSLAGVYSLKSQVEAGILQRNTVWMTENAQSLLQLSKEKESYEEQLSQSISNVMAQASGTLSFWMDGQEEALTPDAMDAITKEQTRMQPEKTYIARSGAVKPEEPVFRLITSNEWHLVAYLPKAAAKDWEAGDKLTLSLYSGEQTIEAEVTLASKTEEGEDARVVFTSRKKTQEVAVLRHVDFQVKAEVAQGIKIPNEAIIEKTLLKLPADCIQAKGGQNGVLKLTGSKEEFVPLYIASYDQEREFAFVLQDYQLIRVGDIVLSGEDAEKKQTTISEIETTSGVYVANSSVAKFTPIEVLEKSAEYSIVKPGVSSFSLKPYDLIVSDAKNIEEGQALY